MRPRLLALPSRRPVAVPRRDQREAVARALRGGAARERVLLALLLFERLTPAEAAHVLRVPAARVERAYAELLSELRETLGVGGPYPAMPARFARTAAQLRRAA
jgi:DNA-directed RNA polymerase specialized sigma24 family protein